MAKKKIKQAPSRIQEKQVKQGKRNTLLWAGMLAIVILLGAAFVFLNEIGSETSTSGLPREIPVAEAFEMRESGAFMLDVRTQEEWDEFHMPGAVLIPLDHLSSRLDEVPRDRVVVVVCRSGNRSLAGRDLLVDSGYESVTSMAGGMNEWRAAGYPVEP